MNKTWLDAIRSLTAILTEAGIAASIALPMVAGIIGFFKKVVRGGPSDEDVAAALETAVAELRSQIKETDSELAEILARLRA